MRYKKGKMMIAAALSCMLITGITYAAAVNVITFVERFETGKVGIALQQLTVTGDGETEAAPDIVEANKDVSYIPRFTSKQSDCYIRAKVDVVMDGDCAQPLGIENIYGLSEDWVQQGEYFYCMKALGEGQQTDLFKGIHIPEDWDPGEADGFSVTVTAEAIQSSNFAPDFEAALPWGAVMLDEIAAGAVCYKAATPVGKVSTLKYTSAGGFECSTEDLFDEFRGLVPGDKCEKTVEIRNDSDRGLRMYLDVTPGEAALTEKMTLRITKGEEVLYYGQMSEVCRNESFRLADVPEGDSADLKFEMGLPVDAGNDYTQVTDDFVWELKAESLPEKSVQTGDYSNMTPYAVIAALAALAGAGLVLFRRKGAE